MITQAHFSCAGIGFGILGCLLLISCGPMRYTVDQWESTPYSGNEYVQDRDNIRVELSKREDPAQLPPNFWASAQACNNMLQPAVSRLGPVMERVLLVSKDDWVQRVAITNNTDHVIRLNQAVIRLFDPSGNQYMPLGYEDLQAKLQQSRPCPTTGIISANIKQIPLVNRNIEIVPSTTFTGYLVFAPSNMKTAGVWKVSLYEVPVKTNQAGGVIKTTHFDIRMVQKHYRTTYERQGIVTSGQSDKIIDRVEIQ